MMVHCRSACQAKVGWVFPNGLESALRSGHKKLTARAPSASVWMGLYGSELMVVRPDDKDQRRRRSRPITPNKPSKMPVVGSGTTEQLRV
jgi:hypothetical protein